MASQEGHYDVVKCLVKRGARIDHQTKVFFIFNFKFISYLFHIFQKGSTSLYVASLYDHSEIVSLLLRNRANPNTKGCVINYK